MALSKTDFLKEACSTTTVNVRCLSKDLTLLTNACHEAAAWRSEHKLPHVEKYVAMEDKLRLLGEELDTRIDACCNLLFRAAKFRR